MFWEPTSIIQTSGGQGAGCLRPDGRKARPLSLQLKQFSLAAYSFGASSPRLSVNFDTMLTRAFASPLLPPLDVFTPTQPAVVVAENSPKPSSPSSLINTLPNEILCLIFDECLANESSDDDDVDVDCIPSVSSDFTTSPLYLSHVCKHWRSTTIAHKKLWSSISVSIKPHATPEASDTRGKNLLRLLRLFLSRAKGTPLHLSLASHTDHEYLSQDEISLAYAAFQLLVPHASKWRTVHFQIPHEELQQGFLSVVKAAKCKSPSNASMFPELSALTLDLTTYVDDCEEDQEGVEDRRTAIAAHVFESILGNSPNLSSLAIDDDLLAVLDYDSIDKAVPWAKLKHIEMVCSGVPTRKLLAICNKAVSLERLSAWRVGDEEGEGEGEESGRTSLVTLSKLRDLKLTLLSDPRQLLPSLSLPSIENIHIDLQLLVLPRLSVREKKTLPLPSILKPFDEMVANSGSSTLREMKCRVKMDCVSELEAEPRRLGLLEKTWCLDRGLKHLSGVPELKVELYKF